MIIFSKSDSSLNIPVGLGVSIGPLDASLVPLEVDSSTVAQSITPTGDGFSSVTVNPYTVESLTVDPSTMPQAILPENADAFSSVAVNAVTPGIDPDIQPGNIREGVEILGVQGTFQGGTLQAKQATSSRSIQTITPDEGNYGLSSVVIWPYTTEHRTLDVSQNGLYTLIPQGADALSGVDISVNVQSTFNWIIEARKGTITDVSNYSLDGLPAYSRGAAGILNGAPITTLPQLGTDTVAEYGLNTAFSNSSVGPHVDISLGLIKGAYSLLSAFESCYMLTDASVTIGRFDNTATQSFLYCFNNCQGLSAVDISIGGFNTPNDGNGLFNYMFSNYNTNGLKVRITNVGEIPSSSGYKFSGAFRNMFSNVSSFEVEIPALEVSYNLNCDSAFQEAFLYSDVTEIPSNITANISSIYSGSSNFQSAFSYTSLTEVEIGVMHIYGSNNFLEAFAFCPGLRTVNITGYCFAHSESTIPTHDNFLNTFYESPVKTVNISSTVGTYPIKSGVDGDNILSSVTTLKNLNIGRIDSEVHLDWQPNLTRESVLGVLTKADNYISIGERSITFYSGGLTVEDYPDGRIQAAYDAAVAKGWTINNLTVNVASSELEIVSPGSGVIDYEDSSTFTFIAGANWTASASDPSVSLSAYSGGVGEFTVTVSVPQGHTGSSDITVSTANDSVTLDLLLPEDINDFTPVDYIESTGQQIRLGNTMSKYSVIRAEYEYAAWDGDGFIATGIDVDTRDSMYNWRFFNYGQNTYFDLGWVDYGGRRSVFSSGANVGERYVAICGLFNDNYPNFWGYNVNGSRSPWYNNGSYYPDYNGSGTDLLCFASPGDYGKLWSLKIYDSISNVDINQNDMTIIDKQPLYDYVPMQRISNGEYGLFETVHNHFYTVAGITGGMDQI